MNGLRVLNLAAEGDPRVTIDGDIELDTKPLPLNAGYSYDYSYNTIRLRFDGRSTAVRLSFDVVESQSNRRCNRRLNHTKPHRTCDATLHYIHSFLTVSASTQMSSSSTASIDFFLSNCYISPYVDRSILIPWPFSSKNCFQKASSSKIRPTPKKSQTDK